MNTYFVISIQEHAFLDTAYNDFAVTQFVRQGGSTVQGPSEGASTIG